MSMVDDLRADEIHGDRQYQREARTVLASLRVDAADALEKLARYTQHSDTCAIVWDDHMIVWAENSICTCGLSELLKNTVNIEY